MSRGAYSEAGNQAWADCAFNNSHWNADCDDSEPEIDPKAVCPWSLDIEEDCDDGTFEDVTLWTL